MIKDIPTSTSNCETNKVNNKIAVNTTYKIDIVLLAEKAVHNP